MSQITHTTDASSKGDSNGGLDLSGRTLADFHLLRLLGQGGMGQVYLAEQVSLKRPVALKILRPELAADPLAMQRFEREAMAAARATHANIVQVYAFGVADGLAYIALEYVEGRNLREYLGRKGPPDLLIALSIMRQVAMALQRAAELGITHRDIKPENILLTRKVEVKVADFGLARCLDGVGAGMNLTQSGVSMGTPLYMSPEQVEGKTVDPRTDIYSFGVTCYHLLAGHPPYQGETAFEVALQHVRAQPRPLNEVRPDLPEALCAIVHRMMAKDPDQRYQTGRELLRDILRVREGISGQTTALPNLTTSVPVSVHTAETQPVPLPLPPARPISRVWVLVLMFLALPLAAGSGALYAWVKHSATPPPAPSGPVDAGTVDAICLPGKAEEALEITVNRYLSGDKTVNPTNGFGPCVDLGIIYLETYQLEKARKHFERLSQHSWRPYLALGTLGLGIVYALSDKPTESNRMFEKVCSPPLGKFAAKDRPMPPAIHQLFANNSKWRNQISRAVDYNLKNGLPLQQVPMPLRPQPAVKK